MADLPGATTRIDDTAGPVASGSKYAAIFAPVSKNADGVPRFYSNAASIALNHDYSQGADYAAYHFDKTGLPCLFVPMAIATPGTVGRFNTTGNSNTSVCSVAVGSSGSLDEIDGVVKVVTGGVVGTDAIVLSLSLDGGVSFYTVKLGTATSYPIVTPNGSYPVGLTLSFAAGSLTAGDTVLTFHSTAPMWDSTGMAAARVAMANQSRLVRDFIIMGEVGTLALAQNVQTAADTYETSNERYVSARVALRDRLPYATSSKTRVNMTGDPSLTFAASGFTVTRASGSFLTDGFVNGMTVRISGTTSNNVALVVTTVAAGVLTFAATIANEGPKTGVTITGESTLTIADGGGSVDTITRTTGSWLADGFRVGDSVSITGTVSNNISNKTITVLTATVMTFATGTVNSSEVVGQYVTTITAGETKSAWVASLKSTMSGITSKRVNLGFGRARMASPFLNAQMRRSVVWDDSVISYQHDLHIPTFKKKLGPTGSNLNDLLGNLYEYDDHIDGGALEAGFTCYRTWGNGPSGAFIAMSLTRAPDTSKLSRQQNMAVANYAQSICQAMAENEIGESLVLNTDGTAKSDSLAVVKQAVESALKRGLLADAMGEGQRASNVSWSPDPNTDLSVPGVSWPCVMDLYFKGTLERLNTTIKVK